MVWEVSQMTSDPNPSALTNRLYISALLRSVVLCDCMRQFTPSGPLSLLTPCESAPLVIGPALPSRGEATALGQRRTFGAELIFLRPASQRRYRPCPPVPIGTPPGLRPPPLLTPPRSPFPSSPPRATVNPNAGPGPLCPRALLYASRLCACSCEFIPVVTIPQRQTAGLDGHVPRLPGGSPPRACRS